MSGLALILDDDRAFGDLLQRALQKLGYRVTKFTTAHEAIRSFREGRPDIMFVDCCLQGSLDHLGLLFLHHLNHLTGFEQARVFIMSQGLDTSPKGWDEYVIYAKQRGLRFDGLIEKPFTPDPTIIELYLKLVAL
jgi:CheY-like chemotaxis protein